MAFEILVSMALGIYVFRIGLEESQDSSHMFRPSLFVAFVFTHSCKYPDNYNRELNAHLQISTSLDILSRFVYATYIRILDIGIRGERP